MPLISALVAPRGDSSGGRERGDFSLRGLLALGKVLSESKLCFPNSSDSPPVPSSSPGHALSPQPNEVHGAWAHPDLHPDVIQALLPAQGGGVLAEGGGTGQVFEDWFPTGTRSLYPQPISASSCLAPSRPRPPVSSPKIFPCRETGKRKGSKGF